MFDCLKILAPQAIQHAAPELGISADAVMRVGPELPAAVRPARVQSSIAELLPNRFRIPVLVLLRHEVAAFDDQHTCRGVDSACAIVPPPAPLPMMMMSKCSVTASCAEARSRSDPSAVGRPSRARGSSREGDVADRAREIAIHRAIAANVSEPWHDQLRHRRCRAPG